MPTCSPAGGAGSTYSCMQGAFRELLPLAATTVPGWQQDLSTWRGRQDAYMQLSRWRSKVGAALLFRDFDGDADDPVNFPTAAAARERPSRLSIYQASLASGMPKIGKARLFSTIDGGADGPVTMPVAAAAREDPPCKPRASCSVDLPRCKLSSMRRCLCAQ